MKFLPDWLFGLMIVGITLPPAVAASVVLGAGGPDLDALTMGAVLVWIALIAVVPIAFAAILRNAFWPFVFAFVLSPVIVVLTLYGVSALAPPSLQLLIAPTFVVLLSMFAAISEKRFDLERFAGVFLALAVAIVVVGFAYQGFLGPAAGVIHPSLGAPWEAPLDVPYAVYIVGLTSFGLMWFFYYYVWFRDLHITSWGGWSAAGDSEPSYYIARFRSWYALIALSTGWLLLFWFCPLPLGGAWIHPFYYFLSQTGADHWSLDPHNSWMLSVWAFAFAGLTYTIYVIGFGGFNPVAEVKQEAREFARPWLKVLPRPKSRLLPPRSRTWSGLWDEWGVGLDGGAHHELPEATRTDADFERLVKGRRNMLRRARQRPIPPAPHLIPEAKYYEDRLAEAPQLHPDVQAPGVFAFLGVLLIFGIVLALVAWLIYHAGG